MIRVFVDASVLFAADYSAKGASREIIQRAIRGELPPALPPEPKPDPEPDPTSSCQNQKGRPKWTDLPIPISPNDNYLSRNSLDHDQRNRTLTP